MSKRILLYGLLGLILCAAVIALTMWFKPHRKVEHEAGIPVTAEALFLAYSSDEQAANAEFLNKTLIVTGMVEGLDTNQDGRTVVLLATGDPVGVIACTLRDETPGTAVLHQQLRIKGICSGMLADVVLSDCILIP
jgi:hypothetical protein